MDKQYFITLALSLALAIAALATTIGIADTWVASTTPTTPASHIIACGGGSGGHC